MTDERILIVEDDESLVDGLVMNLEMEGYSVSVALDGREAVEAIRREKPDLVLLDVMLPELNGFEVLSALRRDNPELPVVMLSARDQPDDIVIGLDLGADDYVTKPFDLRMLLARINAAMRRQRLELGPAPNEITFGRIVVDTAARRVTKQDEAVELTTREYDLLVFLARSHDRVLTRTQILDRVWGRDYDGTERTVDNFVARLRTKVEEDPNDPRHIETVRGIGYRFAL